MTGINIISQRWDWCQQRGARWFITYPLWQREKNSVCVKIYYVKQTHFNYQG